VPKLKDFGRKRLFASLFRNLNEPYSIQIVDRKNREEKINFDLKKKNLYLLLSSIFLLSFILFSLLFMFSPLRYYIPGYETNSSRKKLMKLNHSVDSLAELSASRDVFLQNALQVLTDNESYLLDTNILSQYKLESAQFENLSEIDRAGRYAYLKRKRAEKIEAVKSDNKKEQKKSKKIISSIKEKPLTILPKKPKDSTAFIGKERNAKLVLKETQIKKKRDTIIVYK